MKCDYCPNEAVSLIGEQNHILVCAVHAEQGGQESARRAAASA